MPNLVENANTKYSLLQAMLTKSENFNLKQQVLRTKSRVENNREEPIDYLAKCILTCYSVMQPTPAFLIDDIGDAPEQFRAPFKLYKSLDMSVLENLQNEIDEFKLVDEMKYEPYGVYW